MARPKGSENKDKPYREALRMELAAAGDNAKLLRNIARKHLANAESGDMNAIRELADRLDGKPAQAIEHQGDGATYVVRMPEPVKDMAEWSQRIDGDSADKSTTH